MKADAQKDIENHFEMHFKALQQRKEQLISFVEQLSLEIRMCKY